MIGQVRHTRANSGSNIDKLRRSNTLTEQPNSFES